MKMTDEERNLVFKGYNIHDCSIRTKKSFSFLLFQDIENAENSQKRLLNYFPEDFDGRLDWTNYHGFSGPKIASSNQPKNQTIMVARDCTTAVLGGGDGDCV